MRLDFPRKDFLRLLPAALAGVAGAGCTTRKPPAPSNAEQFVDRVFQDTASAMLSFGLYIGDRLGLFQTMAAAGPATVEELARRSGLNKIYLRDWLGLMVTAKYVDYQPASRRYTLPPEHATVLCDENSPLFMGGFVELLACVFVMPKVIEGFRGGKGPISADYPPELWEGIERSSAPVYRHFLTQSYLPVMPDIVERLKRGGVALDLGCGGGLASIAIAKAYPQARVLGVDVFAPSIEKARANAKAAGVEDRARFEPFDGMNMPPGRFDLITINYSVHHAAEPVKLMASARSALVPNGAFVVLDDNSAETLEGNSNPYGNYLYGVTLFYCTVSTLAEGGPGYGALIRESEVRDLANKAGFTRFRRLPIESRYDAMYEMRA